MPIIESDDVGNFVEPLQARPEKPEPTWGQTFGAAFRMENDVLNAYEALTQPSFPKNADFKVMNRLRELDVANRTNIWDNYRDNFLGVQSEEEMNHIIAKLTQEQKDKETLESAGWAGVVAGLSAGMLSPTVLLPFVGTGLKGGRFVASAAGLGAVGGALQEIPLQQNQVTRTGIDLALSIGGGAVVGGLLGSAIQVLRPREFDDLVKGIETELGMANSPGERPIPTSTSGAALNSGAAAAEYAGRLKSANAMKIADWISPVTRVINQDQFQQQGWMMSQLGDGGLRLEGNARGIASTEGGTIEARVKTYYGGYATITEDIDSNYAKYIFGEGAQPGFAPNIRAALSGYMDKGKLSKSEFRQEIGRALFSQDRHAIPEVQAAAEKVRSTIFDPLLKEGQRVGIFGDGELVGDLSYLTRMYDTNMIQARTQEFIEKLANHFSRKMNEDFGERLAKLAETERRDEQLVKDLVLPREQVAAERAKLKAELEELDNNRSAFIADAEDKLALLRKTARDAKKAGDEETRKNALKDARELQNSLGDEFAQLRSERSEKRRRLQGLSRAAVALEDRQLRKLEQLEQSEDRTQAALMRVARKGQRILNRLDKFTDKEMDAEIGGLKNLFAEAAERYDAGEVKKAKLMEGESPDTLRVLAVEDTQVKRGEKLTEITDEIEALESVNRYELRQRIQSALQKTIDQVAGLNERRALREARLVEQAAALDPGQVSRRIDAIKARTAERQVGFRENVLKAGGELALDGKSADFSAYARELAEVAKDKIVGTHVRLPSVDLLQDARGPELRRMLDIPSAEIADFLELDVEKVVRSYLRTVAPDIEMVKKFGSVNGDEAFRKAADELNNKLARLPERFTKDGILDEKGLQKATDKLNKEFNENKKDLEVVIERLRGTRGLPDNPDGMGYRMAKTVMSLNVLRLMGGTLISSIPDMARPIQRYGLIRTFSDGFIPLVRNFQQIKMAGREARLAGAALDAIMHTRAQALNDILDDYGRHSKFERGIEYATNKMGAIALFDYWTVAMKQLSSSIIIGKITDSLDIVVGGAKASAKEIKEANEFLASKGFSPRTAELVYGQLTGGPGGAKVNGVWMPNTEAWTDAEARTAFRSALASEIDNTIITPGVERANWMDANMGFRMLGQFKSFGMSSTTKVLMAGLQQRDAAFMAGTLAALGLGALSYAIAANLAGGKQYEEFKKAGLGKFADEAINRSGVLGIFSDGQRFLERIPATQPYVSFSGTRTSRRGGDDMIDVLMGPSFGGLQSATKVLAGIDDPTKSTLHEARKLLPFQNLIIWRNALDAIEGKLNLPERRN